MIMPARAPIAGARTASREFATATSAVLCAGAMERPRPNSQGAPLWPDRKEGNHGEDVKEYYFYLDSTPTHSYMKYLYKYPQAEYPYQKLGRGKSARAPRAIPNLS